MTNQELRAKGLAWAGDGVPSKIRTKAQRDQRRRAKGSQGLRKPRRMARTIFGERVR